MDRLQVLFLILIEFNRINKLLFPLKSFEKTCNLQMISGFAQVSLIVKAKSGEILQLFLKY